MTDKEYSIYYQPKLAATSQSGNQATLSITTEDREKGRSKCTLSINGKAMWQSFTCYQSLVWVTWQDVNQDGREDVVITYHAPFAELGVLVYEWDGLDVHLIADVEGKIIQPDLYGTRLENIDDDNALEILAGNYELAGSNCKIADLPFLGPTEDCWYAELNFYDTVYDWDGTTYVDRGRVP